MASTKDIAERVRNLGTRVDATYSNNGWNKEKTAVNLFGNYWYGPSCQAMVDYIRLAANRIESLSAEQLKTPYLGEFLAALPEQLDQLQPSNMAQQPEAVGRSIMSIIGAILASVPPPVPPQPKPKIDWVDISEEPELLPQDLLKRLRAVEGRINRLEPRSQTAEAKLDAIDAVHEAATRLPTDMEELEAFRAELQTILAASQKTAVEINLASAKADGSLKRIAHVTELADNAVKASEAALRGSTGVGLANAFVRRKDELTSSSYIWVAGLVASLAAAVFIGADRVSTLKDVLISDRSSTVIWVNALLAALGVGAPVWFAWLSTKQIGANFKMAEDYAFKASVSQAYEGYRKEAVDIDPALRERLFTAALSRLEQEPLRLVSKEDHSSPLQEALSSPALQAFWNRAPGLYDDVLALVKGRTGATTAVVGPAEAVAQALGPKQTGD